MTPVATEFRKRMDAMPCCERIRSRRCGSERGADRSLTRLREQRAEDAEVFGVVEEGTDGDAEAGDDGAGDFAAAGLEREFVAAFAREVLFEDFALGVDDPLLRDAMHGVVLELHAVVAVRGRFGEDFADEIGDGKLERVGLDARGFFRSEENDVRLVIVAWKDAEGFFAVKFAEAMVGAICGKELLRALADFGVSGFGGRVHDDFPIDELRFRVVGDLVVKLLAAPLLGVEGKLQLGELVGQRRIFQKFGKRTHARKLSRRPARGKAAHAFAAIMPVWRA